MAFPFDFGGDISFPSNPGSDDESFQRTFLERARDRFERAHADVDIYGREISFELSLSRMPIFSVYYPLLACSGKIILHPQGTITYYLDCTDGIIIMSVVFWVIFGSFFIFVVNGPLPGRLAIVVILWLVMVVSNSLITLSRFKTFVARILSDMNVNRE